MIRLLAVACLSLSTFTAAEDEEVPSSLLRFANEDQLPGAMESLSKEHIVWSSPIQTKPAAFWLKEPLTRRSILGVGLTLGGVSCMLWPG